MTQVGEEKAEGKLNHLLGDKEGLSLWGGGGWPAVLPASACGAGEMGLDRRQG